MGAYRDPSATIESYAQILDPGEAMEPILAPPVRGALLDWLTEIWAADELAEVGLAPRAKALFYGPPGVGKTTLAHHLAARLGLPMAAVRPERLIDSWLGSTARNIATFFQLATDAPEPYLLFFDEFEVLSSQRRKAAQGVDEERNAFTNVFLHHLDEHPGYVIAATNKAAEIDQAIWRRFQMQVALDLPGQDERKRILARYLDPFGLPGPALAELATAFETASPALMRQFAEGLKRQLVVGPLAGWDMGRNVTIGRVLASVGPHPDLGQPRLWSLGIRDGAVQGMPWPLPRAGEVGDEPPVPGRPGPPGRAANVVDLSAGGRS